jgi:hypothetical protein
MTFDFEIGMLPKQYSQFQIRSPEYFRGATLLHSDSSVLPLNTIEKRLAWFLLKNYYISAILQIRTSDLRLAAGLLP